MDGLDRLIKAFERGDASGRAGIFDDEENATKLLFNEVGTVTAPARPTLTPAYDERAALSETARGIGSALGRATESGSIDAVAIVAGVVADIAESARENIRSNTPPALADSTIDARRSRGNESTDTLIDTGDMLSAVRSEAKPGAEGWRE